MLRVLLVVSVALLVSGGSASHRIQTRSASSSGGSASHRVHTRSASSSGGSASHRIHTRSASSAFNWNSVVDFILEDAKREIVRQNLDEISLEDVEEEFRRKWSFILIDSRFVATGGRLKSFSSIERSGNASVSVQDSLFTLTCDISMRVAKIRYDNYEVEMWQRSIFRGDIKGNIGNNRVRVVLDFEMKDGRCVSSLREVKVLEIGGFEVEVSGLGPLDELASQISSWVSKKREGQIIKEIQYYLSMEIRKALEDFQCDEYAGILMVSF